VRRGKANDAVVIGHERAVKFDRTGHQQAIGRVAVLQFGKAIGSRTSTKDERHGGHTGTLDKTCEPVRNGQIELDFPAINQQRYFPSCDSAQQKRAAVMPALGNQASRGPAQPPGTTVEP
jgi:hypothetical protein